MRLTSMVKILSIGYLNTLRFNFHYFGIGGVIRPRVLLSRKVKILQLSGNVICKKPSSYKPIINIGFHGVGILDYKYERTVWQNSGTVIFNGRCALGSGCRIANAGEMVFGDGFVCTGGSSIISHKKIVFGENDLISWDVLIMDTDFHNIKNNETSEIINFDKEITIGNNVWIGCRCLILKGVSIPNRSVIAAGSTISKTFYANNTIISNNKILKTNVDWND